jgi:hypothetical protein
MHARIDHLLSLRDGEPVAASVADHVRQCPICAGELQRLSSVRAEMQALPSIEPPAIAWERIRQTTAARGRAMQPRKIGFAAAAAAAITIIAIAFVARHGDQRSAHHAATKQITPAPAVTTPHVAELVAQSQQLEQLLQILPARPRIERVSTAAAIDTIEQRIQWLDFQMSNAPDSDLNEVQSRQLWRERVELMDSLVKIRYVEAGSLSF